jgi:hypothetical protein
MASQWSVPVIVHILKDIIAIILHVLDEIKQWSNILSQF